MTAELTPPRTPAFRSVRIAIAAVLAAAGAAHAQPILYVDAAATGANNGSSWADAFTNPQQALAVAVSGDQIRVAQGRYAPGAPGNRAATFTLVNGVALHGGYAGVVASDPDARDINTFEAVLSGDLNNDDTPTGLNTADNSHHVVTAAGVSASAVIDGFTITAGNADASSNRAGGGMFISSGSPTITSCLFEGNHADAPFGAGGGLCSFSTNPLSLADCIFFQNSATGSSGGLGGGAYIDGPFTLDGCEFEDNTGTSGGGLYFYSGANTSTVAITACTFLGNEALLRGGGIFRSGAPFSFPTISIDDTAFSQNLASEGGAINFFNTNGGVSLTDCTFAANTAYSFGGALQNFAGGMTATRCLFTGNAASSAGGAAGTSSGSPLFVNCTITGNTAGKTGGISGTASNSSPQVLNSILWNNSDSDPATSDEASQIAPYFTGGALPTANYSCIQGYAGAAAGSGNIALDPFFFNASMGDFTLDADSPCIDAGDPSAAYNDPDSSPNDMGAFPYVSLNADPVAASTFQQLTAVGDLASIRLDASASSDPDNANAELTYTWSADGAVLCDGPQASCETITVSLAYGTHDITLRVTDPAGAFDEETQPFVVCPAALALLAADRVGVRFHPTANSHVGYHGEIALPYGLDYTEVDLVAAVSLVTAGVETLPLTTIAFQPGGDCGALCRREWCFTDPSGAYGITKFNIDWRGSRFNYQERNFPVTLKSQSITSTESTLTVKFKPRRTGAFTLSIGGATIVVDASGNATANVAIVNDEPGEIEVALPFAIVETTTISFSGSLSRSFTAADHLTQSVGRFNLQTNFPGSALPNGAASTPRTVDLQLFVGTEAYPGSVHLGPDDLTVRNRRWVANP